MICNFTHTNGRPPSSCSYLPSWLYALAQALADANPIRCAEDTDSPTTGDLDDLWGACSVPTGAFVTWYNSTSGDTLYFTYDGANWWEFTLS